MHLATTLTLVHMYLVAAPLPPPSADPPSALGCYTDTDTVRSLNYSASAENCMPTEGGNSLESCARLCCAAGFKAPADLMGVEYGCQCFCGHRLQNNPSKRSDAECNTIPCPGKKEKETTLLTRKKNRPKPTTRT